MKPEQDPKYDAFAYDVAHGEALSGRLVNRASGQVIPDDEPVFILRARDVHAFELLRCYLGMVDDGQAAHRDAVRARIKDFQMFALDYPERMKRPDSP